MPGESRLCSNCRAVIPKGATECPKCGTFAGDMFDGRLPAQAGGRRRGMGKLFLTILAILIAGGIVAFIFLGDTTMIPRSVWRRVPKMDSGSPHVVGDRPGGARRPTGATLNEPEAIRTLRRFLAADVKAECLAVMSKGYLNGAYELDALDRCHGTHLGHWRVDGKTGDVMKK